MKPSDSFKIEIEELNVLQRSSEWYGIRNKYLGASEIGALLGIDKYSNPKILLFQKLGFMRESKTPNMILGAMFENDILEKFSYFEYDEDTTYENYLQNRVLRKTYRVNNSYLLKINDVPFIVSPDGYFIDDGQKIPVETKFINNIIGSNNDYYIGKFAWQSVMQQLLYDVNYGYIFTLIGNTKLSLNKIMLKDYMPLINNVLDEAKRFYEALHESTSRGLSIVDVNKLYYNEYLIKDTTYIKKEHMETISNQNIDNPSPYIQGDDDDAKYASKYITMSMQEKEIKEFKHAAKNYFKLKYGDIGQKIYADIYKIRLFPKFTVSIRSTSEMADDEANETEGVNNSFIENNFFDYDTLNPFAEN